MLMRLLEMFLAVVFLVIVVPSILMIFYEEFYIWP